MSTLWCVMESFLFCLCECEKFRNFMNFVEEAGKICRREHILHIQDRRKKLWGNDNKAMKETHINLNRYSSSDIKLLSQLCPVSNIFFFGPHFYPFLRAANEIETLHAAHIQAIVDFTFYYTISIFKKKKNVQLHTLIII